MGRRLMKRLQQNADRDNTSQKTAAQCADPEVCLREISTYTHH
jgi:hypothetical protein